MKIRPFRAAVEVFARDEVMVKFCPAGPSNTDSLVGEAVSPSGMENTKTTTLRWSIFLFHCGILAPPSQTRFRGLRRQFACIHEQFHAMVVSSFSY